MTTHPLTVGQEALWFLHDIAPDSAAYNVAFAFAFETRSTSTRSTPPCATPRAGTTCSGRRSRIQVNTRCA
ncbi:MULTISPECIES: hypothetical protein [Saccharothrix]|uniref:hypothetical protein n=1 Tax=Saccharothrix TaxID=2071 RepID=UPI001F52A10D|nr:hypothetical protein [Saccharothrix sp. CB00851]